MTDTQEMIENMNEALAKSSEDDIPLELMIFNLNMSINWGIMAIVVELRNLREAIDKSSS